MSGPGPAIIREPMTAPTDPDRDTLEAMDAAAVQAAYTKLSAASLEVLIRRANREYWDEDAATLPDTLYDLLAEEALLLPPAQRFGAAVIHKRPMLSLDKCYNEADLQAWAASSRARSW
jgi:DNA ligase (NAD+)